MSGTKCMSFSRATTAVAASAVLLVGSAAAAASPPAHGGASRAVAAVAAPPAGELWPACDVSVTQFCVDSLTMDGVDMSGSDEWQLQANILDSGNGTYSANWYLRHSSNGGVTFDESPPAGTEAWVAVDLNMGDIQPRYTQAQAEQASITTGGNATTGWTMHVEGRPTTANWKVDSSDGQNCYIGACGGLTTKADTRFTQFGGNTQDLSGWTEADKGWATGMWIMTNAQYFADPLFEPNPGGTPYWLVQLANVHLDVDGNPAFGHYSARVSEEGLTALGTNATEASALGLDVRRVTDGSTQRIDSAVMPTGDGGIYIRIPRIAFSSPQLKVYGRQAGAGHNATLAPDPPRWSGTSALNGGAALRFNRPFFDGGATLSSYTGRCTASGQPTMSRTVTEPGRVEVVGLANDVAYTCQVRAQNTAGKAGRWTYTRTVTPTAAAPAPAPRVSAPVRTTDASAKKQVRVTWSAPAGVTYAPGTTFTLTRSANGSSTWRTLASGTTATSRTVSVQPGTTYRFKVTAKEPGNAASAATTRITVAPFDDAATAMKYAGTWRVLRADNRYLGGVHRAKAAGATVTLTRKGSRIWIVGDRGPATGEFRVRIDGGTWSRYVDTRNATLQVRQVLWTSKILRNKEHTVRIQVRGTSGRPLVAIDGIAFLR